VQAALCARPRKAVDIKVPLKNDAKLEGIHAKLIHGELTIAVPKRVSALWSWLLSTAHSIHAVGSKPLLHSMVIIADASFWKRWFSSAVLCACQAALHEAVTIERGLSFTCSIVTGWLRSI